ncbi:hypothetical protein pb186bvf_015628 [Paramecium bursaria]
MQKQPLSDQVFKFQVVQQIQKSKMRYLWKPWEVLVIPKQDNNSNEINTQHEKKMKLKQSNNMAGDQDIFLEREQLLYCKVCKISFPYQNKALYHKKHIHNDTSNIIQCDFCQKSFFGYKRKLSHQFRYHRKEMRDKIKQQKQQKLSQSGNQQI